MEFKLDQESFYLGMIEAFSEVVMQEVKDLAFGPPMSEETWKRIKGEARKIFKKYGVTQYEETRLVNTDLSPRKHLEGKLIPIIYLREEHFEEYLNLRTQVEKLEEEGLYSKGEKKLASIELRKLLGYSERAIRAEKPASFSFEE